MIYLVQLQLGKVCLFNSEVNKRTLWFEPKHIRQMFFYDYDNSSILTTEHIEAIKHMSNCSFETEITFEEFQERFPEELL